MRALPKLAHLVALTDDTGILQHAKYDVPNRAHGYCTDDVARAFIVAIRAAEYEDVRAEALRLGGIYLAFLFDAQITDGRFHNFMAYDRRWLDEAGSEDACGRAVWALGFGAARAARPGWRELCAVMLERALPSIGSFEFVRGQAYAALGLAEAAAVPGVRELVLPALERIAKELRARYDAAHADDWQWFEDEMVYDNARLCEAALRVGAAVGDRELAEIGLRTLAFYETVVFERDVFVPIGNLGWFHRGGPRARFDQQPLEAEAMVEAEIAAYAVSGNPRRLESAEDAFAWFVGRNTLGETLASEDGACCDGLSQDTVNKNMGAESTLAYLGAAFALTEARRPSVAN